MILILLSKSLVFDSGYVIANLLTTVALLCWTKIAWQATVYNHVFGLADKWTFHKTTCFTHQNDFLYTEILVRDSTPVARKCSHNNLTSPSPGDCLGDRVTRNAFYPEYPGVPEGVDCTYNDSTTPISLKVKNYLLYLERPFWSQFC